jgi:hypothetical protein
MSFVYVSYSLTLLNSLKPGLPRATHFIFQTQDAIHSSPWVPASFFF